MAHEVTVTLRMEERTAETLRYMLNPDEPLVTLVYNKATLHAVIEHIGTLPDLGEGREAGVLYR